MGSKLSPPYEFPPATLVQLAEEHRARRVPLRSMVARFAQGGAGQRFLEPEFEDARRVAVQALEDLGHWESLLGTCGPNRPPMSGPRERRNRLLSATSRPRFPRKRPESREACWSLTMKVRKYSILRFVV